MSRRTVVVAATAALVVALGGVVVRGLQDNLVYFRTPSEVQALGPAGAERVRLGGRVRDGSIERSGAVVRFVVEDRVAAVPVVLDGAAPAAVRAGEDAIVEGVYGADRVLRADTLLMKHDERYDDQPAGAS